MSEVRKYEMPDFGKARSDTFGAPKATTFEAPVFSTKKTEKNAANNEGKSRAFKLDENVSNQLGIAQLQKDEAEKAIAREIERRWEKTAEKAEVAGYTKGLEEGKKEAYVAELPRIKERLDRFDRMVGELDRYRDQIFQANESFLMGLIAQTAGMVALKEIQLDKDYVRRLVTTLIHQLGTREDLKIFLSPSDSENLDILHQALEKEFGKLSNTVIETSSDIKAGGCKIETRFAVVDASVEEQIHQIVSNLKA